MSWQHDTGDSWTADVGAGGDTWTADAGGGGTNGFDSGNTNGFESVNNNGFSVGGTDVTCRNCNMEGHFSRDCPEPKQMTGECFNCGEVGHTKQDCTNPRVEREFTGTCNTCQEVGHRAGDCPTKPKFCKNCHSDQHKTGDCTDKRKLVWYDVPDVEPEVAWQLMMKADKERDLDDFKGALKAYGMKVEDFSFADIEMALRDAAQHKEGGNIFLIGLEREIPNTFTLVDLKGNTGKKYSLGFYFSEKPRRRNAGEGWPKTPEDNLERLKDAGFPMDALVIKCGRCAELGHIAKNCKEEKASTAVEISCALCSEVGHRARDCTQPRVDPNLCRNCKQPGHRSTDCTEPRSAENVQCRKCEEYGHFSKDCPNAPARDNNCRNCGEEGHMAKECDKPKNPDNVTCRNCDTMGHFSRDCPLPRDYSKVQCSNCQEYGHTKVRCKKPEAGGSFGGGYDNLVEGANAPTAPITGEWNDGGATADNFAPAGIATGGW